MIIREELNGEENLLALEGQAEENGKENSQKKVKETCHRDPFTRLKSLHMRVFKIWEGAFEKVNVLLYSYCNNAV